MFVTSWSSQWRISASLAMWRLEGHNHDFNDFAQNRGNKASVTVNRRVHQNLLDPLIWKTTLHKREQKITIIERKSNHSGSLHARILPMHVKRRRIWLKSHQPSLRRMITSTCWVDAHNHLKVYNYLNKIRRRLMSKTKVSKSAHAYTSQFPPTPNNEQFTRSTSDSREGPEQTK